MARVLSRIICLNSSPRLHAELLKSLRTFCSRDIFCSPSPRSSEMRRLYLTRICDNYKDSSQYLLLKGFRSDLDSFYRVTNSTNFGLAARRDAVEKCCFTPYSKFRVMSTSLQGSVRVQYWHNPRRSGRYRKDATVDILRLGACYVPSTSRQLFTHLVKLTDDTHSPLDPPEA